MGTWEQPDIIVDESLQGLTAGFGQLTAGIAAGFDKRNAARAARKKAAAKTDKSNNKWKEIAEIKTNYGKIGTNPNKSISKKFDTYVEKQLSDLALLDYKSTQWHDVKEEVKTNLYHTSIAMGLLDEENEQFNNMYIAGQNTGTRKMKGFATDGAPLIKSDMIPYYRMQYNWGFNGGSNIEFKMADGHQGYLEYTPEDGGDPVRLDFNTLTQAFPKGEGYFGTVTKKATDDKMKGFWNNTKSIYTNVAPTKEFDRSESSEGYVQERITSYQNAEEAYINALDENKNFLNYWGEITQNDWQVMGFESEFTGTPQEIEDFKDEVLFRTSTKNFKRDKVEGEQQEGWRTALTKRLNEYQSSGIPGFPTEFGESPGSLKAYEGKNITYNDVVTMSEEVAKNNEIPELAELLNKMSVNTTKKKFMTGTQVEQEIITSLDNYWKINGYPPGIDALSTWREKLEAASGEKDNPYQGINPDKYDDIHGSGKLFVKNTDFSYPNEIIGIHGRGGEHDAKAIESLILEQSGISRTDRNAMQSGVYGSGGNLDVDKVSKTTTGDPRVYEAESAEDKVRIENRELLLV